MRENLETGADLLDKKSSSLRQDSRIDTEEMLKQKSQKVEQFLTRAEKINKTIFPTSGRDVVIIKAKKDGIGFQEKLSKKQMNYLPVLKDSFCDTIKEVNKIMIRTYCYKRSKDDYDFLKENMKYLKFIFISTTVGFVVLALSEYEKDSNWLFVIGFTILMLSIMVTFIVAFTAFFKKRKYIDLNVEMERRVKEYLEIQNKSMTISGMRWNIGDDLKWLEFKLP